MKFLKLYNVVGKYCAGKEEPDCKNHLNKKDLKEEPSCPECRGKDFIYEKQWNVVAIALYTITLAALIYGILSLLPGILRPPIPPTPTSTEKTPTSTTTPTQPPTSTEKTPKPDDSNETSLPKESPKELPSIDSLGKIKSLEITPDGQTIATGNEDGKISLWQVNTGQVELELTGHQGEISAIAISADGQTLASASEDGTIKIWDLATGKERYTLTEGNNSAIESRRAVTSLAISADGQILVAGGQDTTVKVWNLETKELTNTLEVDQGVESLAISQDARLIVSGNAGGKINIWNFNNGKYEQNYFGSGDSWERTSVTISSDGQKIVSGSCKNNIRVWNNKMSEDQPLTSSSNICLVAISQDGKIVAGLSTDKTVKLWDLDTRKELYSFPMPSTGDLPREEEVRSIAFSGNGRTIAVSLGKTIQVWQLPSF